MRLYQPEENARTAAAAMRWSAAVVLVLGLHGAAGWWILTHSTLQPPPDTVQGIPINLEPIAVPQNAAEPNSAAAAGPAPAPQAAAAPEPTPPMETPPPAVEPPPPGVTEAVPPPPRIPPEEIPPRVTPSPEPPPPVAPPSESAPITPPPTPPDVKSEAVLASPPPPVKPPPPKPDPRALARETAKRKAVTEKRAQEQEARREARAAARAPARAAQVREGGGQRSAAPAAPSSASSGADTANWRGAVVAHLNGFKPSANGASGTARVAFAVDRGGRVLGANLAGSSGDPQLDAAAVEMVRRASPVPAPPPELGGRINLTVPVRFH